MLARSLKTRSMQDPTTTACTNAQRSTARLQDTLYHLALQHSIKQHVCCSYGQPCEVTGWLAHQLPAPVSVQVRSALLGHLPWFAPDTAAMAYMLPTHDVRPATHGSCRQLVTRRQSPKKKTTHPACTWATQKELLVDCSIGSSVGGLGRS